jgi:hypothetical protein
MGTGQIGNMMSNGSPFMDKGRLRAFLIDSTVKKLKNYSI